MHALKEGASRAVIERPLDDLKPCPRNARTHSRKQLRQIARSIERFGFTNPVLIDDEGRIIAGHGRVEAARLLGLARVRTLTLSHLSPAERRAYMIADNKLALNAGWDPELLAEELQELIDVDFDVDLTGFSLAEIDAILDDARDADPDTRDAPEDAVPPPSDVVVTRRSDLWKLGEHFLLCGDARDPADLARLMQGRKADLVFTDPRSNVKIDGNVCGPCTRR
jgi:ParB-like chromosome segregation protein Spo0J